MKILILNGPNLNLLGSRETKIYGYSSLGEIEKMARELADDLGVEIEFYQSNHEGALIDGLHQAARDKISAVILNPGALAHYSIAMRDAIAAIEIPVIEIHVSNIYSREEFRRTSVVAPVAAGQITGFGVEGYLLALRAAVKIVNPPGTTS
ncbi:MAG TPA: type II 3-dehydroquinate dehydratase [Clostridia bacterium]|nr:type II 3-dehydroquinate dehydratase [Clostridia bacterium]